MSDAESPQDAQTVTTCANCGAVWSAGGTSFCGECGFSERLGQAGNEQPVEVDSGPSPLGIVVFFAGVLVIPFAAIVARCCIWESGDHLKWMYWMAGIGGGMAVVGHLQAWGIGVAQSDMDLADVFFGPIRIWSTLFRSLPKGVGALCLFGFGMMTLVSGGLCFGVDYETVVRQRPYETREQLTDLVETIQGLVPSLASLDCGAGNDVNAASAHVALLSEEASSSAGPSSTEDDTSPVSVDLSETANTPRPSASRQSVNCLVIGYIADADGELLSLVLAVPSHETIKYAGAVPIGDVEPDAFTDLIETSLSKRLSQPVIDCPVDAVGLQPDAVCRVTFDGWSEQAELIAPRLLDVTRHIGNSR